jgi:MarR family transcriptional regulator, negative regulator of the multidrug operon emrRAB
VTAGLYPGSSISTLAAIAGSSHSVMVRNAARLVGQGLAERANATDGRVATLVLTEAGQHLRGQVLAARAAALGRALAGLGPAEQAALAPLLARMLQALTDSRATGDRICRLCDEDSCGVSCPVDAAQLACDSG